MSSTQLLGEIIDFMDVLHKIGRDAVIKEGNITLSVSYDRTDPYKVKEELEYALKTIMEKTPSPFGLPLTIDDPIDLKRIIIHLRSGRIEMEFEFPPVLFPKD